MRAALLVLVLIAGVAAPAVGAELTLSVAVSMKEAVEEVGRAFAGAHPGVSVRYNLGASGELQKQIEAGAPVDLFISAGERQMDELQRRGLIVPATRRVFARNVLVAVTPAGPGPDLAGVAVLAEPKVGSIAVGNPRTVPAGQYTEESLRALGVWDRVRGKLVFAENVRQVLDYVSRGEVDVGFVYATDVALRAGRVREAFRPPEDSYRPIVYPAAVVSDAREPRLARAFLAALTGADGQAVLRRRGFRLP